MRNYDRWGVINSNGEIVIDERFENSYDFHNGLCRARVDQLWGYIDYTGQYVIIPKYNNVEDFFTLDQLE
ncbi:MAG: WG repeat-containing protein [Bacteroidetes bacterium]|nr:WG repeat-containing protein [Bacteroidota bacterium]